MTKFAELETEYRIAERQYESAAGVLTLAKASAERRLVYFQLFVRPSLPQDSGYPKRLLSIAVALVGAFLCWSLMCGLVALARNNMA
jgi:capsule polysaccharide export protein KpsE/RkpR